MHVKKVLKTLGPGVITGASDDDPSGIATYSQTGAQFGYSQLWSALLLLPCMTVVQQLCGKVGIVTGKGLAQVIKKFYGYPILIISTTLLFIANIINIGADLGAMASSGQLVFHLPFVVLLLIMTVISVVLEIFISYKTYARFLKYLTFSLLAYIITAFMVKQNWTQIFINTIVPHISFSKEYAMNIVALLGTTISPYLFFWQTAEEIEEQVKKGKLKSIGQGKPRTSKQDIKNMKIDTMIGMLFSNIVMWFIIITTASTLGMHGINNIETADQAAQALKPFAGDFAFLLFAVGIVGTGFLAVPILAGSISYALAETFGWKEGLYRKFHQAYGFYAIILIATLIGLMLNLTSIKPFKMLYYAAILNGIAAPPLMVLIMLITNNKKIIGRHANSILENTIGWIITVVMSVAAFLLLLTF